MKDTSTAAPHANNDTLKTLKAHLAAIDPARLGKVGVLMGGRSAEREISLISGQGVLTALRTKGVNAHPFDPCEGSLPALANAGFDRVFIALHGRFGEDGCIQGVLEYLGIPYTGSGVTPSALAMRKDTTKLLWQAAGLPTPRWCLLTPESDFAAVAQQLGSPLIVKPASEGSTLGLSKVHDAGEGKEVKAAFAKAFAYDRVVLAEEFIAGTELTCAVLTRPDGKALALPPIRISAPQDNYDYEHKYFSDDTLYFCPSGLNDSINQAVEALTISSYQVLDCQGWGRADLIQRHGGKLFLLEINTSPGMTPHSLVPMAARECSIDYEDLCLYLLSQARCHQPAVVMTPPTTTSATPIEAEIGNGKEDIHGH